MNHDGSSADEGSLTDPGPTATLTASVLAEEAARRAARDEADAPVLFADELLPGVGSEPMTFAEGLRRGGAFTFFILLVLNSLDELEGAAMNVLAPDIRDTFGVSDGTIVFIASASSAFFVLGAMPMGWLADRYRRAPIVGWASVMFSAMVVASGMAVNAFMLFWTRFGAGIAKANTLPVHSSLLADTYPIGVRGRIGAVTAMTGRVVAASSPLLAGGVATLAGGDEGWRWAFLLLGVPVAVFALAAFRIPEPPRGQWEKDDVLATLIEDEHTVPISIEAAFARLLRIRTVRTVIVAFSALGFSLFTIPVLANLYLEDEFGLGSFERGVVASVAGFAAAVVLPFAGIRFDRLYRTNPTLAFRLVGLLILPGAVLVPLEFLMPNVVLFAAVSVVAILFAASAFSMVGPLVQTIVPYRLRGLGSALVTMYIFFIGATGGALLSKLLTDAYGVTTTVFVLAIPSNLLGGLLILRGASFIRHDLSLVVAELREELEEHQRRDRDPDHVPALQVNHVDFSYGNVQVLFDLSFEVYPGETLALLGTNGAGKSTALRVVTGLGTPQRGVVRLDGRTITFATPEQRAAMGIQMLPGGRGVFPSLTIGDNLRVGAYRYRRDPADVRRRIDRVVELFPALQGRLDERAGDLSGGQQQMLALARVLLHDPRILIIDELSLGLAPTVVADLLEHLETLRRAGQTMIIVEQSLNVALAIADRAVFLEKGQVRFEGPASELAERDDLARAVFLGGGSR